MCFQIFALELGCFTTNLSTDFVLFCYVLLCCCYLFICLFFAVVFVFVFCLLICLFVFRKLINFENVIMSLLLNVCILAAHFQLNHHFKSQAFDRWTLISPCLPRGYVFSGLFVGSGSTRILEKNTR